MLIVIGIIWGTLSAQFLMQAIMSLIAAAMYLVALVFADVPKNMNGVGALVSSVQTILFSALLIGGNWLAGNYVNYASWNAASSASLVAFLATLAYVGSQMPGKILLARYSAWVPFFAQAAMGRPRSERVALAWQYRASPTAQTLYPSRK